MFQQSKRLLHSNRTFRPKQNKRAGVASLEFVMGLPFLMLVMAVIYAVAYAGVNHTKVVFQARHQVWKMRESGNSHTLQNYKRITDTQPMKLLAGTQPNDMPGEVSGTGSTQWTTYSWLGGSKSTRSKTVIITGTWDHKEITNFDSNGPHFGVLDRIGGMDTGPLTILDSVIGFVL